MRRLGSFLSILALAVFLAVSCHHQPSDDTIATQIRAKMFSEPALKSASVEVTSKDGIVTLTGQVPDDATRLAARTIASQTQGVKQVIDSTTVAPPAPAVAETPAPPPTPEFSRVPEARPSRKKKAAAAPQPECASIPAESASAETTQPEPAPAPATPQPAATPAPPPPPPPPQPITVTVPEGSIVTVRTIDAIDSANSSTGQPFAVPSMRQWSWVTVWFCPKVSVSI